MRAAASHHAALARITGLVDAVPQFEHLAPTAADAARELTGAQGVWVCVRRRRNRDAVLRHALGIEPRLAISGDVPIGSDPLIELAVLAGRDLFMPDYVIADVYDPFLFDQGVRSVACAPIAAGSQQLGALVAFRTRGPAFGPDDAARLAQAGTALAVVLTAHEARREHARALARERLLARAAFETASAPALGIALQRTAEGAADVCDAVFAAVLVSDGDGCRVAGATPGPIRECLTAVAGGHLSTVRLAGLERIARVDSLAAGRPLLFVDALGLLARLGLPVDSPDVRGRLAVLEPIAEADGAFGAILVLLEADAPDPAVFGSLETLASNAAGVIRRARLHHDVEEAYLSTVTALANALEAKDAHTHEHASETARLAVEVGRELGLDIAELRDLEFAAVLHDVGKIAIPEEVLNRRGPLSPEERLLIQEHTVIGERILRGIPFLASAASAVRSAHERWDGDGYPDALAGERIPMLSRIIFGCDTWDVMTSDRPYRLALDVGEARRRLSDAAGSQLDPAVVDALERVLERRGGRGRGAAARSADAVDRAAA
jgi:HD-GYP domain-containing protein (c-di-GMP phosphodiesterase class II)